MKILQTEINDVLLIEPQMYEDERGFFYESYNRRVFAEKAGVDVEFVQDNYSSSIKNVLRGLHYQMQQPQGKLVQVLAGVIFDVAVDIRKGSATFGKWVGCLLSAQNKRQVWIPIGFAHGFLVLSDKADVLYKTTNYYAPDHERCILWNDPDLSINWELKEPPILSAKDRVGQPFKSAELFP